MATQITTSKLAVEVGISQNAIQKRLKRLGIVPEQVGRAFLLTQKQADKVRTFKEPKK